MERIQNEGKNGFSKTRWQERQNWRGKVAACPDGTPPDDMEEGVSDEKDDKNEIFYE